MRIGIFGGSFDPVHIGHLIVADAAAHALELDEVRFVPTCVQPFKVDRTVAAAGDRVAMLRIALDPVSNLLVDEREIHRGGVSYTIDTLESLRREFPEDGLFLLVGADAARDLGSWREANRFPDLCTVAVLTRPGSAIALETGVRGVEVPAIEVSSTMIRDRVRAGEPVRHLLPPGVADYIDRKQLYR